MSRSRLKVAFDTAGGQRAGVGHLLRSIALAGQLRSLKAEVTMLSKEKALPPLVLFAMRAARLDAASHDASSPQVVVIDRPDTTLARLRRLHRRWPAAMLVALDYYGPSAEGLALVINLNEARERLRVGGARVDFRGLRFAILRASFRRLRQEQRRVPTRIRQILVGFGGTDPKGWSQQAIQALTRCVPRDVSIHLLSGGSRPGEDQEACFFEGSVTQHIAVADPAPLLRASDLAVIGGGTMLIEAACLGVPAVVVPRTPEERLFARQFARAGAVRLVQAEKGFPAKAIQRHVTGLFDDADMRRKMQQAGRQLVDGRGANRVAKLIVQVAAK